MGREPSEGLDRPIASRFGVSPQGMRRISVYAVETYDGFLAKSNKMMLSFF